MSKGKLMAVNGASYYVQRCGTGEPIVFLHGFTGDHCTWVEIIQALKTDYECITIDLLGHGKTKVTDDVARYHIIEQAKDIRDIITQLGMAKIHLVGYSMGGRLALTISMLYPEIVKSLILESASPGLKTKDEQEIRQLNDGKLSQMIEEDLVAFVEYWENIPLFHSQKRLPTQLRQMIRSKRLQSDKNGLILSLKGMGTGSQPSWWNKLNELQCPVCLIVGSLDSKFVLIANEMKMLIKNATLEVFEEVGHAIHVEHPEKFGTIVIAFLSNVH
jgi:2-succinyl-6-hydroxy-2,4-cyclohexadiene-1-carboxylate synthase